MSKKKSFAKTGIVALASIFSSVSFAQEQKSEQVFDENRIYEEIIKPSVSSSHSGEQTPEHFKFLDIYNLPTSGNANPTGNVDLRMKDVPRLSLTKTHGNQILKKYAVDGTWIGGTWTGVENFEQRSSSSETCDIKDRLSGNLINFFTGKNFQVGIAPDSDEFLNLEIRFGGNYGEDLFEREHECLTKNGLGLSGSLIEGFNLGQDLLTDPNFTFTID